MKSALSKPVSPLQSLRLLCNFVAVAITFFLVCLVSLPISCEAEVHTRVLNGTPSNDNTPWMASISYVSDGPILGHTCGGVVIDPWRVLTAAHCVADYVATPEELQVAIGIQKLSTVIDDSLYQIDGIIVHPDYNPMTIVNDIAIIRLSRPVTLPSYPHIAGAESSTTGTAVLYGWGLLYADLPVRPDRLQRAEIPLIDEDECANRIGVDFNASTMICAGKLASAVTASDGVDSCNGDSGGPLVVSSGEESLVVGLVSWGFACGSDRVWGVYTKTATFADWIASQPTIAPYPRSSIRITGIPAPGQSLTCNSGEWGGDLPQKKKIEWIDTMSGQTLSNNVPRLKIKSKDVGREVSCVVHVTGPGGEVEASSDESVTILPKLPRASRQPSIAAARGKSTGVLRGTICKARSCMLVVGFDRLLSNTKAIYAPTKGSPSSAKVQYLTGSTVGLTCRRGSHGTFYLRALFEKGTSSLSTFRC